MQSICQCPVIVFTVAILARSQGKWVWAWLIFQRPWRKKRRKQVFNLYWKSHAEPVCSVLTLGCAHFWKIINVLLDFTSRYVVIKIPWNAVFYYAFQSVCKGLTQSISALHGKDYLDCCTTDFHSFYLYHKIQVLVHWTKSLYWLTLKWTL